MSQHPSNQAQHQRMAQTSDGYTFYEQPGGRWTDTADPEACDLSYDCLDDLFAADPELVVDGRLYSEIAGAREQDLGGGSPLERPHG